MSFTPHCVSIAPGTRGFTSAVGAILTHTCINSSRPIQHSTPMEEGVPTVRGCTLTMYGPVVRGAGASSSKVILTTPTLTASQCSIGVLLPQVQTQRRPMRGYVTTSHDDWQGQRRYCTRSCNSVCLAPIDPRASRSCTNPGNGSYDTQFDVLLFVF